MRHQGKLDKALPSAQYFIYESIGDSVPLEGNAHMKVEIWSDVVCPWCYIGKRRFESALAEFPQRDAIEVIYRSFQLDPTAPLSFL